jgi:YD repeat-containing protein
MGEYWFETLSFCKPKRRFALGTAFITFALGFSSAALEVHLGVNPPNALNGASPSINLTWDAALDGVYLVQSKTNLENDVWKTEEPVKSNVGPIKWMAPEALERSKYYQLVLPQPEIFNVEPAVGIPGMPVDVYIIGQGFGSNDTISIGDVLQTNIHFISPTLLQVTFTPDVAGSYAFALTSSSTGQISTLRYAWSIVQQPAGSHASLKLLEPPQEPPASPSLRTYTAGRFELDNITGSDIQEGKKGLNAVNVKLASRTAGGGGGGSIASDFALWPHMHQTSSHQISSRQWAGTHHFSMRIKESGQWWVSGGKQKIVEDAVGEMRDYEREPAHLEIPNLKIFSGEVQVETADMIIPGRSLDFVWARTYRSRTGTNTAMGNGWDFSYNLFIQPLGGDILVHDGAGRDDQFFHQTNGTYSAPGFFSEGTLSNNVFRLTFADAGFWEFNPLDSSVAAGKIARSQDRNGNAMTFGYDDSGRLSTVIDDLGRTNTVTYNSSGLIQAVTDFSGRACTYRYYLGKGPGSPGDLQSFTTPPVVGTPNTNDFPAGKTTSYAYTTGFADDQLNHNLLSITDGMQQTWLQVVYGTNTDPASLDYDAVDYVQRGPYRTKLRRFLQAPTPSNDFAVVKSVLNDGAGNVSECFYDSRNRCVRQLDYTGRANPDLPTTETDNRPLGKLRKTDPDFYETRCAWNLDSLCTRITYPNGDATTCIYERDFDKNASARKKGDLRIVRELACCTGADTDGDGVNDLTERAWHFSYDPRFGSPATCNGKKLYVGNLLFSATDSSRFAAGPRQTMSYEGGDGSTSQWPTLAMLAGFNSGPRQTTSFADAGSSREMKLTSGQPTIIDNKKGLFITGIIDPRGNTSAANYDAQGNLLHCESTDRKGGAVIACDFNYKEHGKLAAITNAPNGDGIRRVDTFNYYDSGPQTGYLADWTVDSAGPTVTITRFEYDPHGKVTRCVDPRTNDWLFTYNALDQMVRYQTPTNINARCATDYFYDAADNLVQTRIEVRDDTDTKIGTYSRFKHPDLMKRCLRVEQETDSSHLVAAEFQYDANDNLVLYRSPEAVNGNDPDNVVSYTYDERDLLFQETHGPGLANGKRYEHAYDLDGNRLSVVVTDALGNTSAPATYARTYDGFNRPATATDAMGNVTTTAFDANDNLVYERLDGELNDVTGGAANRRLSEKHYTYDGFDRCVHTSEAFFNPVTGQAIGVGGASTSFAYALNGQLVSSTDDNGHRTVCTYDRLNHLATITDPKTNLVTYTYDACGNLLSRQQVDGSDLGGSAQTFVSSFVFDALNRCISDSDNAGNTNLYSYDSCNNVVRYVDHNYNVSRCNYDGLNRCTLAIADLNADGLLDLAIDASSLRVWDDNSRLVAMTDANTNTTHYAYDSLDRLVVTTNADQTVESLIWSPRSNLASRTDANGTTTVSTYDLLDRCLQRNITPASGVASTTTFETYQYDGLSRCVMASNNVSRLNFAYDSLGNCVSSAQDGFPTTCTFDGVGNRLSMAYPGGRIFLSTYDGLDRVSSISTIPFAGGALSGIATYAYDGPDRLSAIFRTNGVNTRIRYNGLQGQPNPPGDLGWQQVVSINHARGAQAVDRRIFAYDGNQNKILRAQVVPFVQDQPTTTNFWAYTALNQLSRAINTKGTGSTFRSYHLDGKGNRIAVTNDATVDIYTRDATLPEPADLQMDQYTVTPFGTEQHDHNGNLVQLNAPAGQTTYFYDYANRLVEVDRMDGTGTTAPVASFSYDALGRRISKTTYPGVPSAPVTTQYVHGGDMDCDGVLEERVGGAVSRAYCRGITGDDLDRDLWPDCVAFTDGGEPMYYHTDELGNVLALTDANGNVLERYDYDEFGVPSFYNSDGTPLMNNGTLASASLIGNSYLFHSMWWDGELGLYDVTIPATSCGANPPSLCYNPQTGRFTSRYCDNPMHAARSIPENSFSFTGSNPWSCGVKVRKMVPITLNECVGGSRKLFGGLSHGTEYAPAEDSLGGRSSVGNGSAGIFLSKGAALTRPGNHKSGKMVITKDWSNTMEW